MGPLRPETVVHVEDFLRCGDLAAGFTRFLCPDCGHQHLLAFTCKSRHFCPACHQRRTLRTGAWIANSVCHPVPHRQFVFTIPRMLRGIFRKRRHLLHLLFNTATATLRDAFRIRLNLPDGRIAAAPAVHTFGDYLLFHPHLRLLGLWEGLISLPPPPDPPFDIETFEPIEPPWQAIRAWIPADDDESETATPELWDQSTGTAWKAPEIDLGDGRTLVLDYT